MSSKKPVVVYGASGYTGKPGSEMSAHSGRGEITGVPDDWVVELRGFEPRTSLCAFVNFSRFEGRGDASQF